MDLYLVKDSIKANEKIIRRLNLVCSELKSLRIDGEFKSLHFDGEFYRFRGNDADYGFDGFVYGGNDLSLDYAKFQKRSTEDFFNSNNGGLWLSGTDLVEKLSHLGREMSLEETTIEQGFDFGTKLINAYNAEAKRVGKVLPKGIPNSVIVFDPFIAMIMNPIPYLKGISQAEKDMKEESPQIYMFAGKMQN